MQPLRLTPYEAADEVRLRCGRKNTVAILRQELSKRMLSNGEQLRELRLGYWARRVTTGEPSKDHLAVKLMAV